MDHDDRRPGRRGTSSRSSQAVPGRVLHQDRRDSGIGAVLLQFGDRRFAGRRLLHDQDGLVGPVGPSLCADAVHVGVEQRGAGDEVDAGAEPSHDLRELHQALLLVATEASCCGSRCARVVRPRPRAGSGGR
ncbi:hypothetical protein ACFPM0_11785 [Pseudonocardia sulfidoxydans]|uniref:hypothetical protein n=1 Tax=Pseudonocardia sulfidoxydans TaxID=54011 RepID=UPI003615C160